MRGELTELVAADVAAWLSTVGRLLYNERDMQMHLASYLLESGKYSGVELEYYVHKDIVPGYVWDSELKLDIVVSRQGQYVPVELKYKTKEVARCPIRFGEEIDRRFHITKTHSAPDLGRYDFWKDVRRLELVKRRLGNVAGGVALFLTNDGAYLAKGRASSNNIRFSMAEGYHGRERSWLRATRTTVGRPDFLLDHDYSVQWQTHTMDAEIFHSLIIVI